MPPPPRVMAAPFRPAGPCLRRLVISSRSSSASNLGRVALSPPSSSSSSLSQLNASHQSQPHSSRRHLTQPRWHSTTSSSVNPDEVSHFNALAADWWDTNGSSRLLHLMNPLRHDFIAGCLASSQNPAGASSSPDDGLTYLDIGCGGGIFAESAARLPTTSSVTAIDPTPSVLAIARAHARKDPTLHNKLSYKQTSIEGLDVPPQGQGYDIVSLFEVIEHIDDPSAFLDKVRPFVKPGGWLVMSTIARTWTSWLTTNLVAEDLLRIVPRGTHDWAKYINEEELRRYFMDKKGWGNPRVMGVVYVPGLGWKEVRGSEKVGNYFFAIQREGS